MEFDVAGGMLRVNGRNIVENKHVKVLFRSSICSNSYFLQMGAYHTLDLEMNRTFTLTKLEWDLISLERIDTACDVTQKADIAAIVLQEGLANVMLITTNMTVVRQRIETPVPRKRKGSTTNYDKGLVRFFDQIYQAIIRHVDFTIVKVLIIASPGFVKVSIHTRSIY